MDEFQGCCSKSSCQQCEASKLVQETMLDTCRHLIVNCDVLPVKEIVTIASIVVIFQKLPVFVSGFHSSHILTGWKDSGWELFVMQPWGYSAVKSQRLQLHSQVNIFNWWTCESWGIPEKGKYFFLTTPHRVCSKYVYVTFRRFFFLVCFLFFSSI